jgi:osmotically inducible lipoprotein OsmB
MKKILIFVVAATLVVSSCAGMSTTEQRVLSGGAIGASGGALIGWAAGNPAIGAAVGGGAGALGGLIYDQFEKSRSRGQEQTE